MSENRAQERDWRGSATDAVTLRNDAYPTGDRLRSRASIYSYLTEPFDLFAWVLGHLDWSGGERVLDVGCGPGLYLPHLRRLGARPVPIDLSEGMVREADGAAVASAQCLPFQSDAFDVVLAGHMLYHLPDQAAGLAEFRRVVRPGGAVFVVTNGRRHLDPMRPLMADAGGIGLPVAENFTIEDGGVLREWFATVELTLHRGTVEVPELEPLMRYVESCRALDESAMAVPWEAMVERFAILAAAAIERDGCFRMTTEVGCFTCRP